MAWDEFPNENHAAPPDVRRIFAARKNADSLLQNRDAVESETQKPCVEK